jgi:Tat protein translocase TatB subunit
MLSIPHLIIIFLVALIVLGPDKLPQVARVLGKTMAEFRRITADFRSTIEGEVREMDRQAQIRQSAAAAQAEVDSALKAVDAAAHDVSQTGVEHTSQTVEHTSQTIEHTPQSPASDGVSAEPHSVAPVQTEEPVVAGTPASLENPTNGQSHSS